MARGRNGSVGHGSQGRRPTTHDSRLTTSLCLALLALGACRGEGPGGEIAARLQACTWDTACAQDVAAARALPADVRSSRGGQKALSEAIRAGVMALAAFPVARTPFLESASLGHDPVAALAADATALAQAGAPRADAALEVLAFLRSPSCAGFVKLESYQQGGGPMAAAAGLARLGALGHVVGAVDPLRAEFFAEAARGLIGCAVSERTRSDALLVEARNRFYDLADACPAWGDDEIVRAACAEAKRLQQTASLPLPYPDSASGDFGGAMLPLSTRGQGLRFTPPWVLVLAAGRVALETQVVVPPGARQAEEPHATPILDLRVIHRPADVAIAIEDALLSRPPPMAPIRVAAIAADRSSTVSDLMEIFDALDARVPSTPVLAVLPARQRSPRWLPVNYGETIGILLDSMGERQLWGDEHPMAMELSPFAVVLRAGSDERSADLPRAEGPVPDLREPYKAAVDLAGTPARPHRTLATVAGPVPVALMLGAMETLSVRVPAGTLNSASGFAVAEPLYLRGGTPSPLLPVIVLNRAPAR